MRTWDTFFADVLPDVPGCPEPQAERALLHAARRFCKETGLWRHDLQGITTLEGVSEYTLTYPDGTDAVRFVGATLNGQTIGLEVMDGSTLEERLSTSGSYGGTRLLTRDRRKIRFVPGAPKAGQSLVIEAVLLPSESAAGLEADEIAEQHGLTIACGALEILLMANKAPWTNPPLAMEHGKKFQDQIDQVRVEVWKAYTNRRPRSRASFF